MGPEWCEAWLAMYGFYAVLYVYAVDIRLYGIEEPMLYACGTSLLMIGCAVPASEWLP